MSLIQSCKSELDQNLPYLRHPVNTVSAVAEDIRKDFAIGADFGIVSLAELVFGSLLFALLVVPLGIVGKLSN